MPVAFILAVLLAIPQPAASVPGDGQIQPPQPPPDRQTITIEATHDATLIEDPDGAFANGSGPALFVGRTSSAGARRALLSFDVAGALPADAIVDGAALTVFMTPSNADPHLIAVHRVLADWGEGPSVSSGGGGRPSMPGDVTWIHTFWDTDFWPRPGGQFVRRDSAVLEVGGTGLYTWRSTEHLVQDVRLWQRSPDRNFGWILVGDESIPQTSKSFASREHPDAMLRPVLHITWHTAGSE